MANAIAQTSSANDRELPRTPGRSRGCPALGEPCPSVPARPKKSRIHARGRARSAVAVGPRAAGRACADRGDLDADQRVEKGTRWARSLCSSHDTSSVNDDNRTHGNGAGFAWLPAGLSDQLRPADRRLPEIGSAVRLSELSGFPGQLQGGTRRVVI